LQFLTFQESPKYGFELRFLLLLQRVQVKQNCRLNAIGGRVSRGDLPDILGHDFHRSPSEYALQAGAPVVALATIFARRISMMTDPATAIKHEVLQLVELQIETLRREGKLTDCDLEEYRARSGKISHLYQELDRIGRTRFDWRSERAS
jgi:hypothetical protein